MNSSTSSSETGTAIPRRARRPAALLLAAGMILAVELTVAVLPHAERKDLVRHRLYNPNVTPSTAESIVQWQVAHATLLGEQQDLLLLGDSASLVGLEADLLMERTGLKTWNLGTFGFIFTSGQADILKLFIERNGPPRFLVYHTSHYSLTADWKKKSVRTWVSRLREWLDQPETARYLLPSLRRRQKLRNAILAMGKESVSYTGLDVPRGRFPSDDEIRRKLWENRGSLPDPLEADLEEELGDNLVWEPKFHPDCVDGLKRIFEMAREHGFPVLVQFNPLPEQGNTVAVRAAMAKLEADLREAIRPYPWVGIYEPFTRFYPNDLCIDMRHVNVRGARRGTEELAEWIRAHWLDRPD